MSHAVDKRIPEVVRSKLAGLRLKINSWLFIEALSRLLPTVLGLVLFVFAVDYLLEMDIPQRIIISVLSVAVVLVVAFYKLIKPFSKSISDDALCLEVEKQNADLHNSLISAVQFSRDLDTVKQGVSPAMVAATIEQGTSQAQSLRFDTALNEKRFFTNVALTVLSVFLLGALVFGMLNDETLNTFMKRLIFFDGKAEYAKNTYLEFCDEDGNVIEGPLVIYRGQDCPLYVRVREDSLIKDVEVKMYYRDSASGSWVSDDMTKSKNTEVNEFKIVYKSVAVEFEVQARGGDGRTKRLQVKLDEPPQFTDLSAEIFYPDYTIEVRPGDLVRVFDREQVYKYLGPVTDADDAWEDQGDVTDNGQKLIEWGLIDADQLETIKTEQADKPELTIAQLARELDMFTEHQFAQVLEQQLQIKTVRTEYDRNLLRDPSDFLESFGGKLTILDGCSIKLTATANCDLAVASLIDAEGEKEFQEAAGEFAYELMIPASEVRNGDCRIKLRDSSMREPPRAPEFQIDITADESPEVKATLKGISGLVINRAKIPFSVTVTDDHGATRLFLRYSWQDDSGENKGSGTIELDEYEPVRSWDENKPDNAFKVSQILPAKRAVFTQQFFDLDELPNDEKIPEGSGLKFTIVAQDNDNVPAPNSGATKEFLLRVVSEEEFRADLLRREKEARQEFDLIYKRQGNTQTDTEALAADSKTDNETNEEFFSELKKKLSQYSRSQKQIGENIETVIGRMEDLLTEGTNNRLDESTGEFESRYTDKIIGPMQEITDELMIILKGEMDSARREIENDEKRVEHLTNSSELQTEILQKMEAILKEMEKNEGIQEIINRVFEAKKLEEKLKIQTEDEKKKRIKDLKSGSSGDADKAGQAGSDDKQD